MSQKLLGALCALLLVFVGGAHAAPIYLQSAEGDPWEETTNQAAMTAVFGAAWSQDTFENVDIASLFSSATTFIFLDGSDNGAEELEAFLTLNQSALEAWVAAGGRLLLNSAPNEGDGMSFGFGGIELHSDSFADEVEAADPLHPIFQGPFTPVVTTYTGNSFGHAYVTGTGLIPIILNAFNGEYVLAEMQYGSGHVLFGGMTTHNFHEPSENGEAANLRANIIAYSANFTPVPEPASVVLMISGLVGMVFLDRKRSQRANG